MEQPLMLVNLIFQPPWQKGSLFPAILYYWCNVHNTNCNWSWSTPVTFYLLCSWAPLTLLLISGAYLELPTLMHFHVISHCRCNNVLARSAMSNSWHMHHIRPSMQCGTPDAMIITWDWLELLSLNHIWISLQCMSMQHNWRNAHSRTWSPLHIHQIRSFIQCEEQS